MLKKVNFKLVLLCAGFIAAAFLNGCGGDGSGGSYPDYDPSIMKESKYSNMDNWIVFDAGEGGKDADIFLIYASVSCSNTCVGYHDFNCSGMRSAGKSSIDRLAQKYAEHANVYGPYYTQYYFSKPTGGSITGKNYDDIAEAFTYYYETVNRGRRPFIILGYSQGGSLAIQLCTKLLVDKPNYNDTHAITYAAGMSASGSDVNKNNRLNFSTSPNDIGVIASWTPIAPSEITHVQNYTGSSGVPYGTMARGTICTNPLSWKSETNDTAVRKAAPYSVGAHARKVGNFGVLEILDYEAAGTTTTYNSGNPGLGKYHGSALSWFENSIRDNIPLRIDAWKAANR